MCIFNSVLFIAELPKKSITVSVGSLFGDELRIWLNH